MFTVLYTYIQWLHSALAWLSPVSQSIRPIQPFAIGTEADSLLGCLYFIVQVASLHSSNFWRLQKMRAPCSLLIMLQKGLNMYIITLRFSLYLPMKINSTTEARDANKETKESKISFIFLHSFFHLQKIVISFKSGRGTLNLGLTLIILAFRVRDKNTIQGML